MGDAEAGKDGAAAAEANFKKLNPQVAVVEYGIRELQEVTLYPMSVVDQMALTDDVIQKALDKIFANQGVSDIEFVKMLVGTIRDNLFEVLKLSTGMNKPEINSILKDTTSLQAWRMAEQVYQMNLGDVLKNAKGLIETLAGLFPSMRPLPLSANDIPATASSTSPDFPSGTEG